MNHLEYYSDCVLPDNWVIFRKKIYPLTLGHLVVLSRLRSILILGEKYDGTIDIPKIISDILLFILVCSTDKFNVARQFIFSDKLSYWHNRFIKKYTKYLLKNPEAALSYREEIIKYIEYNLATPSVFRNSRIQKAEDDMVINSAYFSCNRVAGMKLGYSSEEIWDIPLKQLNYELLTNSELEGLVNFISDDPQMQQIIDSQKAFMKTLNKQ